MILIVAAWHFEPGFDFKFSHKVSNFIREEIKAKIMSPIGLLEKDPDWFMTFYVNTSSDRLALEVQGPIIKKRSKAIDYWFRLPYYQITQHEYPLKEYVRCYFEAVKIVFIPYGVSFASIDLVRETVEREVLDNTEYVYKDLN